MEREEEFWANGQGAFCSVEEKQDARAQQHGKEVEAGNIARTMNVAKE